ncbi:hypothetical protein FQN49_007982 [Arthroderma sp. PD_2]|nr:hypothetical protein FQN49_007982 [Arthroderma sp. PD_2]
MYEDVSSALPNDPAIVGPLEQVKDQIVEEVSASMQNVWTSIAFHMRRRRRELNAPRKPTVIVFCRPLSICEFAAVEERLLGILNTIETQIHLEFIPGRVVLARPGSPHPRPMRQQPRSLSENPVNGSSIGVKGREAEAGTLGGWLILNLPREKRQVKCALSCYHVIRSEIASVAGHTDTNGVHWDDPRGRLTIEYPADLDGKATMARLDELCKFGPHDQQLQQQYNMLSRLMSGPGIGKVFLASGHQRRKNHRLDWALIETIETFSHNKPPSPSLGGNAEFMLPETGPEYNPHPDAKIRHFGSAKEGDWVVKIGRTTLTSGVINAMKTVTWAPGNTSEEIEIVSEHADFAAGGDSGSFVINAHGELVGLLFAVEKNSCGWDTAYMTPIRLIQDHIKEVTGGGFLSFD